MFIAFFRLNLLIMDDFNREKMFENGVFHDITKFYNVYIEIFVLALFLLLTLFIKDFVYVNYCLLYKHNT